MAETFPVDAIPINGWVMEIPGLTNPHITKVTNINRKTGVISVVDGGTNRKFHFSDGILEHEALGLVRVRDGTADDKAFSQLFQNVVETGQKIDGTLRQFRHGRVVLKLRFMGMLCAEEKFPDMDVESGDKAVTTITAQLDFLEVLYNEEAA